MILTWTAGRSASPARAAPHAPSRSATRPPAPSTVTCAPRHPQAWQARLWFGVNGRGPLTATGIYQPIARRGRQADVLVYPHRFRHHFSHTSFDRGGAEADLMELNGWTSPQMLTRYGARARAARARRTYDRIMEEGP